MSRVGQQPINIPDGVTVTVDGTNISAKGSCGELFLVVRDEVTVKVSDAVITVGRADDTRESKSFHGLFRSLIANMIEGVSKGYSKDLEIQGVGFRAEIQGQKLVLTVGYSSPIEYEVPDDVKVEVAGATALKVSGADKQKVGAVAARIRAFCKAEPYKGKGIRYKGEHVRRKVGKTVA
ncbi:MAG: 50S ribosomal protein L6 [Kiritimatiellae bacterium]|nr:50S ribosomal protein L6 [Kiritimatiellia bacterium]